MPDARSRADRLARLESSSNAIPSRGGPVSAADFMQGLSSKENKSANSAGAVFPGQSPNAGGAVFPTQTSPLNPPAPAPPANQNVNQSRLDRLSRLGGPSNSGGLGSLPNLNASRLVFPTQPQIPMLPS